MSVDNDTRVTTKRGGYAARGNRTTRGMDDDDDDSRENVRAMCADGWNAGLVQ